MKSIVLCLTVLAASAFALPASAADDQPYLGHCVADDTVDPGVLVQACSLLIQDTHVTGLYGEYLDVLLLRRGMAYERLEKYAKAEADYRSAIVAAPGYIDAWKALALLFEKAGQSDAAMSVLDTMVKANGENADILNAACWVRAGLNLQLDVARADCEESLRLDPNNPYTLDTRCLLHYRLGELTEAIADCTAALNGGHRFATSYYIRGLSQIGLGHDDLGKSDVAQANALNPTIAQWFARYGVKP